MKGFGKLKPFDVFSDRHGEQRSCLSDNEGHILLELNFPIRR
jgi:hypothetical protein